MKKHTVMTATETFLFLVLVYVVLYYSERGSNMPLLFWVLVLLILMIQLKALLFPQKK